MTFQQAPFFLGQNDELVEISSALFNRLACPFLGLWVLKNSHNQNAKFLAHTYRVPKSQELYSVHMFQ